jgi:hypothetical protein
MVLIPEGSFEMGCKNCELQDALPLHTVQLSSFWIDATPVTNAAFQIFTRQTGYKTIAERPLLAKDYPGVPEDKLLPGSAVFSPPSLITSLTNALAWWNYVPPGRNRKVQVLTSGNERTILLFTWPMLMQKLIANGLANDCQPKLNMSMQPAVDCRENGMHGVMT